MSHSLQKLKAEKRPTTVRFTGRILYLAQDPDLVRRQLEGEDLDWDPSIPLRDEISTDEITPAYICYYADETLGGRVRSAARERPSGFTPKPSP